MNKNEMIQMQQALATIPTTGTHTITMSDCLQFLDQKIAEAAMQEQKQEDAAQKDAVDDEK